MVLEHIALRDFRCFERLDLDVPSTGLALVGANGSGKTNFLESIYYLHLLRSMRGARDQDLVRFGAAGFHIAARVDAGIDRAHQVTVGFERASRRKRATLDGGEPARLSDALGALLSVVVAPRDVELVAGAPTTRRRLLDITLALTSRRYLAALQSYRGALARRNAALREAARRAVDIGTVAVWEPALAEHGAVLWRARTAWCAEHGAEFSRLCAAIGEREPVAVRYATALEPAAGGASHDAVRDALLSALASRRRHDLRVGRSETGPHRDDLEVTIGGRPLRTYGSAGQHRTAAIALRLIEARALRAATGRSPVLLLDDAFAELDVHRSACTLSLLGEAGFGQTIFAVPRAADIPRAMTALPRFVVLEGRIRAD
jgi:DNA replication and repair protein RecF